jgi:hypothetical protein
VESDRQEVFAAATILGFDSEIKDWKGRQALGGSKLAALDDSGELTTDH